MAKCRECETGTLKIMGTAGFNDLIEVECQNPECGEVYEVEPDGLGGGGLEFIDAIEQDMMNGDFDPDDYDF